MAGSTTERSVSTLGLFGIWLGYVTLFIGGVLAIPRLFGWDTVLYDNLAETTTTIVQHLIVPLAIGAVAVVLLVSWLGWWPQVLRDHRPVPKWMWLFPALILVIALAAMDWSRLGDLGPSYVLALFAAMLLVGFCEETMFRGVLLVGFRTTGAEVHAWAWSTALFSLLHAPNVLLGAPLNGVIPQLGITFMAGTLFYLTRRVSGTLVVPILLHALYDASVFSHGTSKAEVVPGGDTAIAQLPSLIPLVLLVMFVTAMVTWKQWAHPVSNRVPDRVETATS